MRELAVNIWIYIDLGTELAYNWSGRVYCIEGTDDEKFEILKKLSSTDFLVCERKGFPQNIQAILHNKELKGYIPSNMVKTFFENYPDLFFNELDKPLPPLLNLNISELKSSPQKIPDDPLYVITQIYEDESGNQHPILTPGDLQWIEEERLKRWITPL